LLLRRIRVEAAAMQSKVGSTVPVLVLVLVLLLLLLLLLLLVLV
jgi:hypothetical protein